MNAVLVDTHVLLWWLTDDPAVSGAARDVIAEPATETLVSVASLWEVAIKRRLGRLSAPEELPEVIAEEGFNWLPVTPEHAWAVASLPDHHRDPFDRLLIAQAMSEALPIVTAEPRFAEYDVEVLWS